MKGSGKFKVVGMLACLASCATFNTIPSNTSTAGTAAGTGRQIAVPANSAPLSVASSHGVSVAANPEAAKAGALMLEMGGNAVDAAIAAGFAIAVLEPTMNSIGGRSQIILRTPKGEFHVYDGMTEIPAGYVAPEEPVADGYGVIATPGVVSALGRIHSEFGSLPWDQLLGPAIALAKNGFELLPGEAARHASALEKIKDNPGFRQTFLKEGKTYEAGSNFLQPELAETLAKIASQGERVFYEGEVAEAIAADMAANGGFVTLADLGNYRTLDGRYVTTSYRGYEIHTMAAPGGGGLVVKTLNILENFPMGSYSGLMWAAVVNEALAASINTMNDDYKESDLQKVMSKTWAKEAAGKLGLSISALGKALADTSGETSLGTLQNQSWLAFQSHDWTGDSWGAESHHTTHFVTADCEGMTVSITQTVGPLFGSKVITPDLGFVYASTMGTYLSASETSPGSRPRTTIAPTIVTKDGEVVMVLGAAGGLRILSGIVQTISRFIDQGLTLDEAVAAPRIHPDQTTDKTTGTRIALGNSFHAETTASHGWSASDLQAWQAAGLKVKGNEKYGAFSRVHALVRSDLGWSGVADPDWEGAPVAARHSSCETPAGR